MFLHIDIIVKFQQQCVGVVFFASERSKINKNTSHLCGIVRNGRYFTISTCLYRKPDNLHAVLFLVFLETFTLHEHISLMISTHTL